ncbi:MAG: PilZ domain-containing protein [Magnetococcus sp. DMHC-1]
METSENVLEETVKEKRDPKPLAVYGQTVVNLLSADANTEAPVCLLPIYNRDQILCQESYQEFFLHAQDLWSDTLRAISLLQDNLAQEKALLAAADPAQSNKIQTPILDRFQTFQKAINTGDEESIEDNPFLKLTRMIFHLNMESAKGVLLDNMTKAFAKRERMNMHPIPTPREIWKFSGGRHPSFGRRVTATVRWLIIGTKPFISILLFLLSTLTTFRGVNELLQLPITEKMFGTLFQGLSGETARYIVSLAVGISLSLAILDFKGRLFQGLAEKGRLWKGLFHAVATNPRWIILATGLTLFSIYTNYDGIVSLVSKQGELQKQWIDIRGRVEQVLGNERTANPDNPQTLHGLKMALNLTVNQAVHTFTRLPEDELLGIASSQDPRKGPRYWAKHFVVFGGYTEGTVDLPRVYANTENSRQVNAILLGSGLNFNKSIEEKIRELATRYSQHFNKTNQEIHQNLQKLDEIMKPKDRSWFELRRFMTLEYYDINVLMQKITSAFEENKRVYDDVATDLNRLIHQHVTVLRQVDKYGNTRPVEYTISATVDAPAIEGIEALKKGVIPVATHKDITALNRFLSDEYGATQAGILLMGILLFSISLDLGELLLFTRYTIRIAKKDEKVTENKANLVSVWNDEFLGRVREFFEKKEVWFALLSWLPRPSEILMRDALFLWLYKMDSELQFSGCKTSLWIKWLIWLRRLFRSTIRKEICYGFQAWDRALDRIEHNLEKYNGQFLGILYPGLYWDNKLNKLSLVQLGNRLTNGMKQGQERFELSLKQSCGGSLCNKIVTREKGIKESKSRLQKDFEMTLNNAFRELDPQARRKRKEHRQGSNIPAKYSGNKQPCSACGKPGFRHAWRCMILRLNDGCQHDMQNDPYILILQKNIVYFLIYYIYCPLWRGTHLLFMVSFIHENHLFPWSRRKFLYDFCISNRGRTEKNRMKSAEKNSIVDIENILTRIPLFRTDKINKVRDKLDSFDEDWAKSWKLSILHYEKVIKEIEEEARMIRGLGKDAHDVADEMLLYENNSSLGSLLYYESPHNFSLLEQFKVISAQVEDALERLDEIETLNLKKRQFCQEIEETCTDVNRLLIKIKMSLASGDVDYHNWKLVDGDKIYQLVADEIQKIQETSRTYLHRDVVDQSNDILAQLNQMVSRTHQLRNQLMDAKIAISHPIIRPGMPRSGLSTSGRESVLPLILDEQTRQEEMLLHPSRMDTPIPLATRKEEINILGEIDNLPGKENWALAIRSQNKGTKPARFGTLQTEQDKPSLMENMELTIIQTPAQGLAPKKFTSRREAERSLLKTMAEFITRQGVSFRGTTEDISIVGVKMKLVGSGAGLREGMQGTFRFMRFLEDAGFQCRVVRIQGKNVMVTIESDTSRFGLLVMQEILSQHQVPIN